MRIKIALVIFALFVSHAVHAQAWQYFDNAKILSIVQWQDNPPVLVEVAPNTYCSIRPEEKANIALVMMLYSSGRRANFHCHPTTETVGGIAAYPIHRIIAR